MHSRAAAEIGDANPLVLAAIGYIYAGAGLTAEAQDVLRQLQARNAQTWAPEALALVHIALGSHETALDYLEAGERGASQWILFCGVNPGRTFASEQPLPRLAGRAETEGNHQTPESSPRRIAAEDEGI